MASSFYSNDVSISDTLSYVSKGDVQLPDFQRGWVWDDYRIRALIALLTLAGVDGIITNVPDVAMKVVNDTLKGAI